MPISHKRFVEQTDAEWEATRRTLLAPGLLYWILMPIILLGATVRVIMGLVGPEVADWQDWAALALLIVLWTMLIRAIWQRRVLWQRKNQTTEDVERAERRSGGELKREKKRRGGKQ